MTPLQQLIKALQDPAVEISAGLVDSIDREYPFFTLADAMLLQRSGSSLAADYRRHLTERLAINAPDPKALFQLIDPNHSEWAHFYPQETEDATTPSTDDAISTFLETYGHSDPASDALLERLIFNPPAPDYLSLLETEDDPALATLETQDPMFPSLEIPTPQPPQPAVSDDTAESGPASDSEPLAIPTPPPVPQHIRATSADSPLQESLAKIYIRQRRYDKAYEIINTLSLNNPKKSIYFADQLRFLRKLMLNQQSKE